jgi:hypothetical protein
VACSGVPALVGAQDALPRTQPHSREQLLGSEVHFTEMYIFVLNYTVDGKRALGIIYSPYLKGQCHDISNRFLH